MVAPGGLKNLLGLFTVQPPASLPEIEQSQAPVGIVRISLKGCRLRCLFYEAPRKVTDYGQEGAGTHLCLPSPAAATGSSRRFLPTVFPALFSIRYSIVTGLPLVGVTAISFTLLPESGGRVMVVSPSASICPLCFTCHLRRQSSQADQLSLIAHRRTVASLPRRQTAVTGSMEGRIG